MKSHSGWKLGNPCKIVLFYRYVEIVNVSEVRDRLERLCRERNVLGRILVADEGINGTLAGSVDDIDILIQEITLVYSFGPIDWKISQENQCSALPFIDLSVRIAKEIISTGRKSSVSSALDLQNKEVFDNSTYGGLKNTGTHLSPVDFHTKVQDAIASSTAIALDGIPVTSDKARPQETIILDIRNVFEYNIGHFQSAIGLNTFQYSETFDALQRILKEKNLLLPQSCDKMSLDTEAKDLNLQKREDGTETENPVILMYCTGDSSTAPSLVFLCLFVSFPLSFDSHTTNPFK